MRVSALLKAFARARKRVHVIGDAQAGVVAALDLEGRLYTYLDGVVLNRVNPEAIASQSSAQQYLNPGGDGLWPAPEGTTLGYEYPTGAWRVPAGLRTSRWMVTAASTRGATIAAEIDLINNQGLGIPTRFQRQIRIRPGKTALSVETTESITYCGTGALDSQECLLAPWSLCQFDSGPGCEVVFPCEDRASVWDLYDEPSDSQRTWADGLCRTRTDGTLRYQIGLDAQVPWIEYRHPKRKLLVRRQAELLPAGQQWIDIRDVPPTIPPSPQGVRYSVYSDPASFMEIEAVGGCPERLTPGTTLSVKISTRFGRMK